MVLPKTLANRLHCIFNRLPKKTIAGDSDFHFRPNHYLRAQSPPAETHLMTMLLRALYSCKIRALQAERALNKHPILYPKQNLSLKLVNQSFD